MFHFARIQAQPGGMTRAWLAKVRLLVGAGWTVKVVFTSKVADEAVGGWRTAFDRLCGDRPLPEVQARWLWASTPPDELATARHGSVRLSRWLHGWATGRSAPLLFVDSPTTLPVVARARHRYNGGPRAGHAQVQGDRARWGVPRFDAHIVMTMHLNHLGYDVDPGTGALTPRFAERIEDIRADVDRLVVLTHRQAADLSTRYPDLAERIAVIGQPSPPVDRSLLPPRSEVPLCSVVTRLDPNKRLDALIELWAQLRRAIPEARLEIWGSGPDEARLTALAQASPASGSITMAGFTETPLAQMARAWCTVSTSKREAQPLAVMESLAVGTPVVAFDVRYGPAEVIRDGVDGFLIDDRNRAAMSDALVGLLGSRSTVDRMGALALAPEGVGDRFAVAGIRREWLDLAGRLSRAGSRAHTP